MGVPKFYRYMSERYPCLSQVIKEHQIPEFDNLYLDMNGIIHPCSHPNDNDPHFRITEEQIFKDIFHYIECLFRIIRPRKVLFLAVDGVAPRAKMNQQRSRRFRSAKESEEAEAKAKQKGEELPKEKKFDSNVITPGTGFMVRLDAQLRYFINDKVSRDDAWRGIQVYLSGHETPGEGEHKIMEYIRHERTLDTHDPRTRHCLYGLDADLIMLGLATHEPNFSLLREEIKFTKEATKGTSRPEEITFHLLHLSVMRDYIHHEFSALRDNIGKQPKDKQLKYDLERVIDDWVLMGFLVGNDFVPHLPNMHIKQDHLPLIYQSYAQVVAEQADYLTDRGKINLTVFEALLKALSVAEREMFEDSMADARFLAGKRGQMREKGQKPMPKATVITSELEDLLMEQDEEDIFGGDVEQGELLKPDSGEMGTSMGEWDDTTKKEFIEYRNAYYTAKFGRRLTPELQHEVMNEWVRAMQWIMHYYYTGCRSWGWFFPYHYAPFISDLVRLDGANLSFDMGDPFMPFEQLLAVLPAASKSALPPCFWPLMEDEKSEIIDFYPTEFQTDLNGKTQEWESVVLISFIDEKRLRKAMVPKLALMTPEEKARNCHSAAVRIEYDATVSNKYVSSLPGHFPDLETVLASETDVWPRDWAVAEDQVQFGLLHDTMELLRPGFPSLNHVTHKCLKEARGVKIFQQGSRGHNFVLYIGSHVPASPYMQSLPQMDIKTLCSSILGKIIAVGWPHCYGAKVVEISSRRDRAFFKTVNATNKPGGAAPKRIVTVSPNNERGFEQQLNVVEDALLERWGIEIGRTDWLIHAKPLIGRKLQYTSGKPNEVCIWGEIQQYPYQTCVAGLKTEEDRPQLESIDEIFTPDVRVFVLNRAFYGQIGTVKKVNEAGSVVLSIEHTTDITRFDPSQLEKKQTKWLQGWRLANQVGITSYLLSRITGTLYLFGPGEKEKRNIGLNLRSNRGKGKESVGFTKRTEGERTEWLYSEALEADLIAYGNEFPRVVDYLYTQFTESVGEGGNVDLRAEEIWEDEDECKREKERLGKFIKQLACCKAPMQDCGSERLTKQEVDFITQSVESFPIETNNVEKSLSPKMIFVGLNGVGRTEADSGVEFKLWDRVVNCRSDIACPLGWRGTVVGLVEESKETLGVGSSVQSAMCDVVFDKPFVGASSLDGLCKERHGYRIPQYALLKLAKYAKATKPTTPTTPEMAHSPMKIMNKSNTHDQQATQQQPRAAAFNVMEKLARANAISKIMPKQAAGMVKSAGGAGGAPANLAQSIFKNQSLIPNRSNHTSGPGGESINEQSAPVNALLMTGNIRQAQGATKHLQKTQRKKEKPMTGPGVNSLATQQLKNMLKMGQQQQPPQLAKVVTQPLHAERQSRDLTPNVKRHPTIPPDNATKGFRLKRTSLPRLDSYQKATIEEPKSVDLMTLFKLSGVKIQPLGAATAASTITPLTPTQIEHMPTEEIITKELDDIVGSEEVTREESLDQIQKQLNLVLQLENKLQSSQPPTPPAPASTATVLEQEKPKPKPATPRMAMNFANAKK